MKRKNISPYVIQILNRSNETIECVIIGHSYATRMEKNFGQDPNITITSLVPGVSYLEFLADSEKHPFEVVKTIIKSTTPGQLDQPVSVIHPVEPGNLPKLKEHPIVTKQNNQLIDEYKYLFDGHTKVWFKYILGNTTVIIHLYPKSDTHCNDSKEIF